MNAMRRDRLCKGSIAFMLAATVASASRGQESEATAVPPPAAVDAAAAGPGDPHARDLTFSGRRHPAGHLALTTSGGRLGDDPIYNLRIAYFGRDWLGLEATLAHNPASDVHAALHYANATALLPNLSRLRAFATAGVGIIHVFPGTAINANSVTKLLVNAGGGTHVFLRDDLALRFEARSFTVLDQQEAHRGAYHYFEWSGGLTFYRSLRGPVSSEMGAEP
jgi:hypothetical protein